MQNFLTMLLAGCSMARGGNELLPGAHSRLFNLSQYD